MLNLLDMMIVLGDVAIALAVVPPIVGIGVRYRAHYNPKGLQLVSEGEEHPHTGPHISSFFAMMRRVHRIEVDM